jgi:hypothetical protein
MKTLKVGSKITWHFVCKMSSLYGTFASKLCQVIFVRSLSTYLTVLFLILTTNTAFALTGSVNTNLHTSKSSAINAAEQMVDDIQEGKNIASYRDFYIDCQNQSSDVSTRIDFVIKSVWVHDESGFEKRYYGLVDFSLQCFAQNRP